MSALAGGRVEQTWNARCAKDRDFETSLGLSRGVLLVLTRLGALATFVFCRNVRESLCEYSAIYDGARLLSDHHLYDAELNHREQIHAVGVYSNALSYVRLPFDAVFIWPL